MLYRLPESERVCSGICTRIHGFSKVILDTPKNTDRAHLFYEKAGFKKIETEELPVKYDYPYDNSDFFCLTLSGCQ